MNVFPRVATAATLLVALSTLAGCAGSDASSTTSAAATDVPASPATSASVSAPSTNVTGELTVMAAGPLKPALEEAKAAFVQANPGVTVTFDYGHVPTLLTQIGEGVPADVLVTPDAATMQTAVGKGYVTGTPTPVASNQLALVVPTGNPGKVSDVRALADPALTVAVCAAELPCGKLAEQLATKAGIQIAADSQEPGGSTAIVTKAASGEVEVGVVFASDIKAGGAKVEAVPLAAAVSVSSQVTAATLKEAANAAAADAFVAFLASPQGTAAFTVAGFAAL